MKIRSAVRPRSSGVSIRCGLIIYKTVNFTVELRRKLRTLRCRPFYAAFIGPAFEYNISMLILRSCLLLLIVLIISASLSLHAESANRKCSAELKIQLHPSKKAQTKVVSSHQDKFGIYYKLNVGWATPDALAIYELLGYSGFSSHLVLPDPQTMSARIKALAPEVDIRFFGVDEGTLSYEDYMRGIGNKTIPIGMKGQFAHDMLDHAVGYFLLAKTPIWAAMTDRIRELLQEIGRGGEGSAIANRRLARINYHLEAATPAFPLMYEQGGDEYREFVEDQVRMISRLIAK